MCRSKAEGGQRCHAHAVARLETAQAAYEAAVKAFDEADDAGKRGIRNQLSQIVTTLHERQVEFASTTKGQDETMEQIAAARAAGDSAEVAFLEKVAEHGRDMRAANRRVLERSRNTTADGATVTREDVEQRRAAAEASQTMAASLAFGARSQPGLARTSLTAIAQAQQDRRRAAAAATAYDSTPEGQAELRRLAHTPGYGAQVRQRSAAVAAFQASAVQPSTRPVTELSSERVAARAQLDEVQAAYKANPTVAMRGEYERAAEVYKQADRAFLRALPTPAASADTTRPGLWAQATGGSLCDRTTAWRAIELACRDRDLAQERSGALTQAEFHLRARSRALARQSVLDGEGEGKFDPVDKRMAQAFAQERRIPVAV